MIQEKEMLFNLPGVVGYGYGRKLIKGQVTDQEALIVFVEKKRPLEELQDHEIIPAAIDDTVTDVIEIGEVSVHQPKGEEGATNCKDIFTLEIQKILDIFRNDFEKVIQVKKLLTDINLKDYRNAAKFSFQELSEKANQDFKKITQIGEIISSINPEVYKDAAKTLANLVQQLPFLLELYERINLINRFRGLFVKDKKKVVKRTAFIRPALPGVSIGHYQGGAGTFGAVVYDKQDGKPLILSNNHVLANASLTNDRKAQLGDTILQPGAHDGNSRELGKLAKFAALNPYPKVNIVDCALAEPLNAKDIKPDIIEIGKVEGLADAVIGMKVKKSGRTTGLTTGEVRAVEATIKVNYGMGTTLLFENQIITTKMSEPGDSGSLVVDMNNKAVGLLFAGSDQSTIINPIDPVLDLLEVEF